MQASTARWFCTMFGRCGGHGLWEDIMASPLEGSSENRPCQGCDCSAVLFVACFHNSGGAQVLNGSQHGTIDLLHHPDCPFQSVSIMSGGRAKPENQGCSEGWLKRLNFILQNFCFFIVLPFVTWFGLVITPALIFNSQFFLFFQL